MDEQKQQAPDDETNEPQLRGLHVTRKAIERLLKFREELIQETNGQLFEDSAEILRQEREKRTKQLMQAATGQYEEEEESMTTEQIVTDEANEPERRGRPITREAIERLRRIREEIMKERNGKLFEDSAELIRREREKRTEYLMQVISGEYGKDPYEEDTLEEQP